MVGSSWTLGITRFIFFRIIITCFYFINVFFFFVRVVYVLHIGLHVEFFGLFAMRFYLNLVRHKAEGNSVFTLPQQT